MSMANIILSVVFISPPFFTYIKTIEEYPAAPQAGSPLCFDKLQGTFCLTAVLRIPVRSLFV
jgi:hypothetical protein